MCIPSEEHYSEATEGQKSYPKVIKFMERLPQEERPPKAEVNEKSIL